MVISGDVLHNNQQERSADIPYSGDDDAVTLEKRTAAD
jgi:hypothetical protein